MPRTLTKQTKHKIKKNETVSGICKSYGVKDWKGVWDDPANKKLKSSRKKPESIQPGDQLVLNPPGPDAKDIKKTSGEMAGVIAALEAKKARLLKVKAELEQSKAAQAKAFAKNYADVKKMSGQVDAAATVGTLLVGLGSLAASGAKAAKASGEALKKANTEFAKSFGEYKAQQAAELGAKVYKATGPKTSTAGNATMAIADSITKITSPSFWGYAYVKGLEEWKRTGSIPKAWAKGATADPASDYNASITNMNKTYAEAAKKLDEAIKSIDTKIAEAKRAKKGYEKKPQ